MDSSCNCVITLTKAELIEAFILLKNALNHNQKLLPLFSKIEKKAYELLTIEEIENMHKK
jgi:hypothetical protein